MEDAAEDASDELVSTPGNASPISIEDYDVFSSTELVNSMPPMLTSYGNLSANDMRLMHHWSTFTYKCIGVGEHISNVLQFVLPELAFENEFLMNGMLGIASLHRQRLLPNAGNAQKQTDIYRFKAFSSFRKAVAMVGPDSPNYEAALVMSVLLVILCSQDCKSDDGELTVVRWFMLYRGLGAIMGMRTYGCLRGSSVFPMFRRQNTELKSVPLVPTILMNMFASVHPLDQDYAELPVYCKILDVLGILYASLREDGIGANLSIRVISWPSFGSDRFAQLAKESRPRALVILAHYLVFLKLVKGLWWIEGVSDREIKVINNIAGPKYASYMEVPLQAAQMTSLDDIAALMLK